MEFSARWSVIFTPVLDLLQKKTVEGWAPTAHVANPPNKARKHSTSNYDSELKSNGKNSRFVLQANSDDL